jgi:hypothetical protein
MSMRQCQVNDCENEAVTTRVTVRDSGAARIEITLAFCAAHAADVDAGNSPTQVELGAEDPPS